MLANEEVKVTNERDEIPKANKDKYTVTTNSKTGLTEEEEKKLKENLDNGFTQKMNQKIKLISVKDQSKFLTDKDIESNETLFFKGCENSKFVIAAMSTKVCIEKCKDCSFVFNGKVITQVQELWNNINVNVLNNTVIKTVQVDLCKGVDLCFDKTDSFNRVVWAATENLKIHFKEKEAAHHVVDTGITEMKKLNPTINEKVDQFIVRLIKNKVTEKVDLRNELIIRLDNGFPTTEREEREFQRRQEANLQKLTSELLGKNICLGKKKDVGPKIRRNDPCKCGSKKKYKNCCGSDL
ncbi:hypothetical protein BCR36DRAFT_584668 [Piromyces finnis]|uniref:Adenylate cyclase-associated CAP C-terminal domain-containing protein n=1 Tax=Piromyces finnis TaxID=1754191 RepID=A0A1Y1V720_9FUNG|nr:hypothetical protein BCR36DRAFT_584668 [Piromyces finnis]|eukprot:ORX47567.1 hypothetical protein BCR36DRAFT_584668 [Piromyces finnis]